MTVARASSRCSRRRRSSSAAARAASARRRSRPSAALGAASRLGGKVLVLTIDPAKRLADALGLEGIGNVEKQVPGRGVQGRAGSRSAASSGPRCSTRSSRGTRSCCGTRPTRRPRTGSSTTGMYENITARFVQSHDYIAMERLFEIHETGKFDLIIIDTPPTRNALDFLDAPKRMAEFFGGRLLRWLTMPYRVGGKRGARMINVASRPFYQMADRLLGSQFLQDIAEFFLNFQSMYGGFVERAERGRAAAARQAHDVRGRHDARVGAAARGRVLLRAAHEARLPPRRARS